MRIITLRGWAAALASTAASLGAALIGYKRPETGALAQTVQTRLQRTLYAEDLGLVGDGVTANDTAMAALKTGLPTTGARILFGPGRFLFASSTSCSFTVPVVIEGQGSGTDFPTKTATVLEFAAGVGGVTLGTIAQCSVLKNVFLHSRSTGAGSDDGLTITAHGVLIENVVIDNFGRDGVHIDTNASGNANNSTLVNVRSVLCRRRGFHISGLNSNVITLINCDASACQEFGFWNNAAHCLYLNPHADQNLAGAFYDNGSTNQYLSPYAEDVGDTDLFLIDVDSNGGRILSGIYGRPAITNNASGGGGGWIIENNGAFRSAVEFAGNITADADVVLASGSFHGLYLYNGVVLQARTTGDDFKIAFRPRWTDDSTHLSYGTGGFLVKLDDDSTVALFAGADGRMVIGNAGSVDACAALEIKSTTGGLLLPRMTGTQRDAISSPTNGLLIYNTTTDKAQVRAGGAWVDLH